jgi:hypothetical protein
MKMKKAWVAIGMVGLLIGGGFLAFPSTLLAQEKTIVWNIPHTAAPTYYHITLLNSFAERTGPEGRRAMDLALKALGR